MSEVKTPYHLKNIDKVLEKQNARNEEHIPFLKDSETLDTVFKAIWDKCK